MPRGVHQCTAEHRAAISRGRRESEAAWRDEQERIHDPDGLYVHKGGWRAQAPSRRSSLYSRRGWKGWRTDVEGLSGPVRVIHPGVSKKKESVLKEKEYQATAADFAALDAMVDDLSAIKNEG